MNSYATIEDQSFYVRLGYYSLKSEDKDYTEADDFFDRMEEISEVSDQLERFIYWMEKVGNDGIEDGSFRGEGICQALPPDIKFSRESIELRLYCHIVSNGVVILFNGDWKTPGAIKASDCKKVGPHHVRAMGWTRKLMQEAIETEGILIVNKEDIQIKY